MESKKFLICLGALISTHHVSAGMSERLSAGHKEYKRQAYNYNEGKRTWIGILEALPALAYVGGTLMVIGIGFPVAFVAMGASILAAEVAINMGAQIEPPPPPQPINYVITCAPPSTAVVTGNCNDPFVACIQVITDTYLTAGCTQLCPITITNAQCFNISPAYTSLSCQPVACNNLPLPVAFFPAGQVTPSQCYYPSCSSALLHGIAGFDLTTADCEPACTAQNSGVEVMCCSVTDQTDCGSGSFQPVPTAYFTDPTCGMFCDLMYRAVSTSCVPNTNTNGPCHVGAAACPEGATKATVCDQVPGCNNAS